MDNRARAAMIRKIERKVKARYRKRCLAIFFIALIIGLVLGILVCTQGWIKLGKNDPAFSSGSSNNVDTTQNPIQTIVPKPVPTPTDMPLSNIQATVPPTVSPTDVPDSLAAAVFGLNAQSTDAPAVVETQNPQPEITPLPTPTSAPIPTSEAQVQLITPEQPDDANAAPDADDANTAPSADDTNAATGADAVQAPQNAVTDPNAKGGINNPVLLDEAYTFDAQIFSDGMARKYISDASYDTVKMSLSLNNYLTPEYFASKYASKYRLLGTEAGAEITLAIESSTGSTSIGPQNAFLLTFENAAGQENEGFQLMDAEIAGRCEISLLPGETAKLYKRFSLADSGKMDYMVMTYYMEGQEYKVYFKLDVAAPAVQYPLLQKGDKMDAVKSLQERLVALEYLSDTADGIFGSNTELAIRAAQEAGGMTVTGIADDEFQQYIYGANAVAN